MVADDAQNALRRATTEANGTGSATTGRSISGCVRGVPENMHPLSQPNDGNTGSGTDLRVSQGLDSTDSPAVPLMTSKEFGKRFPIRDSAAVKALAVNVKKLRKVREWSQDELADQIGIKQTAVSLIENGRSNPTLLVIEEIARAFGVRLSELLETPTRVRRQKT